MKRFKVSSVSEFIEVATDLNSHWAGVWFRGCGKEEFTLLPGLYWREMQGYESSLEHRFLVSYKAYGDFHKLAPWEKYALMQHHGLPTRLLDWTKSPLVSLFFALHQEPSYKGASVVWVLDPYQFNNFNHDLGEIVYCPSETTVREVKVSGEVFNIDRYLPPNLAPSGKKVDIEKPLAIEAPYSSARIKSQRGCFTVHGSSLSPIDCFVEGLGEEAHFALIEIESSGGRESLRQDLYALGIDEEYIYHDLDSLSQRIIREFKYKD